MRLLLTRPGSEAERTAATLRGLGHEAVLAPMLEIENASDVSIGSGPWSAVLMTSGNAARAIAVHPERETLLALRCFAVGPHTAAAARLAGFGQVDTSTGDGGDLARMIAQCMDDPALPLLYLAGDDRARDMPAELAPYRLRLETVVVYRARAAEDFTAETTTMLKQGMVEGALHYSRRSAAIFVACARKGGVLTEAAKLKHFCLSARVAEPLADMGAWQVFTAARPDEAALLELIA